MTQSSTWSSRTRRRRQHLRASPTWSATYRQHLLGMILGAFRQSSSSSSRNLIDAAFVPGGKRERTVSIVPRRKRSAQHSVDAELKASRATQQSRVQSPCPSTAAHGFGATTSSGGSRRCPSTASDFLDAWCRQREQDEACSCWPW